MMYTHLNVHNRHAKNVQAQTPKTECVCEYECLLNKLSALCKSNVLLVLHPILYVVLQAPYQWTESKTVRQAATSQFPALCPVQSTGLTLYTLEDARAPVQ